MSIYYIASQGGEDIFALDATQDISIAEIGTTTSLPLEEGATVSDHYTNGNTKVTMSGIISTSKSSTNGATKTPQEYIEGIRRLKSSKQPFSVFFSSGLEPLTSCVFESLTFTQSSKNGTSGSKSSYKVTFSVKQIRVIKSATLLPVSDSRVVDAFAEQKKSGKAAQEAASVKNLTQGKERIKQGQLLQDAS